MRKETFLIGAKTKQGEKVVLCIRLDGTVSRTYWSTDIFDSPLVFHTYTGADAFIRQTVLNPSEIEKIIVPIDMENIDTKSIAVQVPELVTVYK